MVRQDAVVESGDMGVDGEPDSASDSAFDASSDLVDEAFDREADKAPVDAPVQPKKFLPWHKPRKHLIRLEQWCAQTKALIKSLQLSPKGQTRPLSYLGLPGDELLDLRTLQGVCAGSEVELRYLGYNATGGKGPRKLESDLSENEVKSLPRIVPHRSAIVPDRVEDIANERTMAHKVALKHAPYDVINLDFCDSVAKKAPLTREGALQALTTLVDLQLKKRLEPWLLFITTRAGHGLIHNDVLAKLNARIVENARASEDFVTCIKTALDVEPEQLEGIATKAAPELTHEQLVRVFGLGIGKWLLGLVTAQNWSVELLDSYGYQVGEKPLDMCSFSFRFSYFPTGVQDPSGLTFSANPLPKPPPEPAAAMDMARKVALICDVDLLLQKDTEKAARIAEKAARLLAQARHNEQEYHHWVKSGCPAEVDDAAQG